MNPNRSPFHDPAPNASWASSDKYASWDFCARHHPEPPQTGTMTEAKLKRLVANGFGQGHLHTYKPWLRVTKHDYSPYSTVGHLSSPEFGHMHHYRSDAERNSLVLLYWLGAYDARDQFPIWPWPHHHLSWGLPGQDHARMPGLLQVAEEAGIRHGVYPGTKLPYIATLDIVSTWETGEGFHFVAHENKPYELVVKPDPLSRAMERLELTRRYLNGAKVRQHIVHAERYPAQLFVNLGFLRPCLNRERQQQLRSSPDYNMIVERCNRWAYQHPLSVVLHESRKNATSKVDLQRLSHLAIWHQDIDHDLRGPLEPWSTLIPGGRALKSRLYEVWSGLKA